MSEINKTQLIAELKLIKKTILEGGGGGVTDTVWMSGRINETMVEFIDGMLIRMGENYEDLENEN